VLLSTHAKVAALPLRMICDALTLVRLHSTMHELRLSVLRACGPKRATCVRAAISAGDSDTRSRVSMDMSSYVFLVTAVL
jgi:hypothetical protein